MGHGKLMLFAVVASLMLHSAKASTPWTPVPLPTPWSQKLDPQNALPEYPRPQLQREAEWINLNGLWQLEETRNIFSLEDAPFGRTLKSQVLVPFPLESALSGVGKRFETDSMWYRRTVTFSRERFLEGGKKIVLHFGAVDWFTIVYVNGILVGKHEGGYDKFSFDITEALLASSSDTHEIVVGVWDPSDDTYINIPLGKQRRRPESIWYTTSSGIWQTVWLEAVPKVHIERLDLVPDVDDASLSVTVHVAGAQASDGCLIELTASADGELVSQAAAPVGTPIALPIHGGLRLWSPDHPFLYDLEVKLVSSDSSATLDVVQSYFGMRKIHVEEIDGVQRIMLNNEFTFQMGLLDQGYWPDGIYTAPTDEALASDILAAKAWGYNMLRKHIKVEPDRWYYHCDRLGMLVWQDMPSLAKNNPEAEAKARYEHEFSRMIEEHMSFPSIVVYVVFNEAWGQYETERVVTKMQKLDPSRLYDPASGWTDAPVGDLVDMHDYVGPKAPAPQPNRASVLGEFGGLGYMVDGHLWNPRDSFCYAMMNTTQELQTRYLSLVTDLEALLVEGQLNAAVYTEIVDVEIEVNGIMTYDRQVTKMDKMALKEAHTALLTAASKLYSSTGDIESS